MTRLLALAVLAAAATWLAAAAASLAGEPRIMNTRILKIGKDAYEFHVTVLHDDTSWEHYADKWEVVGRDGAVIGTRVLLHPHIGEGLFTRSLRGVNIPAGTTDVIIRVHDKVHGYGREKLVRLPTDEKRDTGWR